MPKLYPTETHSAVCRRQRSSSCSSPPSTKTAPTTTTSTPTRASRPSTRLRFTYYFRSGQKEFETAGPPVRAQHLDVCVVQSLERLCAGKKDGMGKKWERGLRAYASLSLSLSLQIYRMYP